MEEKKIEIGNPGIKRALKKFTPQSSISELTWNGFDAGASCIEIEYDIDDLGAVTELRLKDNGGGIPRHQLDKKFKPFLHSNKIFDPMALHHGPSATHGKNGIGRLTFFTFATTSEWQTRYEICPGHYRQYSIAIHADSLNTFNTSDEIDVSGPAGTTVCLRGITNLTLYEIPDIETYLAQEFAWFLELKAPYVRSIKVNGRPLTYEFLVGERDNTVFVIDEHRFNIRYIRWQERLHDEYSKFYFIDTNNHERAKQHTTFNNKGDGFYHSMYIQSGAFDQLNEVAFDQPETDNQQTPPTLSLFDRDETIRELLKKLDDYLRNKRKPFLHRQANLFTNKLEEECVLPDFGDNIWDQHRKSELVEVVRDVYEADPRLFNGLNNQQKQTMVGLFNLIMDSSERDKLLDVLAQVVSLETRERAELARVLQTTHLSNITAAIRMIEDRFIVVEELKKMVFDPSFYANERDNLQVYIERHYWLFGEQFHLVTAGEPDFEQALRQFCYLLTGETTKRRITHKDKNKEMDIFAFRRLPLANRIDNIVVELKHPEVNIGSKELGQVKTYMNVILKQDEFNASNMTWRFYLVGNSYNNDIKLEIENAKGHGEEHLVYKVGNYTIFVVTWSEIFTHFELSHKFILDKLKLERTQLATSASSADDLLINVNANVAGQQQNITVGASSM